MVYYYTRSNHSKKEARSGGQRVENVEKVDSDPYRSWKDCNSPHDHDKRLQEIKDWRSDKELKQSRSQHS